MGWPRRFSASEERCDIEGDDGILGGDLAGAVVLTARLEVDWRAEPLLAEEMRSRPSCGRESAMPTGMWSGRVWGRKDRVLWEEVSVNEDDSGVRRSCDYFVRYSCV